MGILGNDIDGGLVWSDESAHPIVVLASIGTHGPDENKERFPEVFNACAVTRAMRRTNHDAEVLQ